MVILFSIVGSFSIYCFNLFFGYSTFFNMVFQYGGVCWKKSDLIFDSCVIGGIGQSRQFFWDNLLTFYFLSIILKV